MASEDRRTDSGLSRELFHAPYRFDFFQAVRLLEHRRREQTRARPETGPSHEPVGADAPEREVVRFRALPSLSFPPGLVSELRQQEPDAGEPTAEEPAEMTVSFLGLTGPSGVMPRHYTHLLLGRIREKDYALRDFLDLFNHRLISLFYRAWEKYRLPSAYERSQLDDPNRAPDLTTWALYCLVGLGTPGLRGRLEVDDHVFLYFSGHFAHMPRSAVALESLLSEFLELPVRVEPLQGQWLNLDPDSQARMPNRQYPEGRNNRLDVNLIVGERVWDVQSKFRLRIGPLRWGQFRSLMPNGAVLRPLCQVTRMFVGLELDFDVQPMLRPGEVPPSRLALDDQGLFLGWDSWLASLPIDQAVDDAVFAGTAD